jgi:1,4-alpha-glucan branching enzyme
MNPRWLDRTVGELRAPVPVPAGFEARVVAAVRRSGQRRLTAVVGGTALAAASLFAAVAFTLARQSGIEFQIDLPAARAVSIVGDFNDWDRGRTPLVRVDGTARWRARIPLADGLYRYAFLVDGQRLVADPAHPVAPDPDFGTEVSLVSVESRW